MLAILFLVVMAIIAVFSVSYLIYGYQEHARLTYPYGLADREKADALQIAFSDPTIHQGITDSDGKYTADIVPDGNFSDSGFLNASGKFTLVNVQSGKDRMPMWFTVLADVRNGREMEARYTFDVMPMPTRVTIPAESAWYRSIRPSGGIPLIGISVVPEPGNATVYPIIVNATNFERLRNGQAFDALKYTEYATSETMAYDGSKPITSSWSANVTATGEIYLVLRNNGSYDGVARFNVYPPGL